MIMEKTERLLMEAFAVMASYLALTVTIAGAVTISTFDSTGTPIGTPLSIPEGSIVSAGVTASQATQTIAFSVSNGSSGVSIDRTWLFACRDMNPQECMQSIFVEPQVLSGNGQYEMGWSSVSEGEPGSANLLSMTRYVKAGRVGWSGSWHSVNRSPEGVFTVTGASLSQAGVYATSVDIIPTIRQFIESYGMVPANPSWITKVVLSGAGSIYEVAFGGEDSFIPPERPSSGITAGEEVSSISDDYSLLFREAGSVSQPLALYMNPSYTCGMLGCESGSGETSANCCLDCGCGQGYYCDTMAMECRQEASIALSVVSGYNPKVSNCYESHELLVPARLEGAPGGFEVTGTWCRLGGVYSTCECERSGSTFTCSVTVPPVEECDSGEFKVTDNGLKMTVQYMDGEDQRQKTVETGFPDVTVGSFVCGENGCETWLGESMENCCMDCPCPGGDYCNYMPGEDPSSGECYPELSASDFRAASLDPPHFYDHEPNQGLDMLINIGSAPRSLSIEGISCGMECAHDQGDCSASCSLGWDMTESYDPDKANLSVMLTFTVQDYNPLREYRLSPVLGFDLEYRNGTGNIISETITKTFRQVSIGAHWCGDGYCGEDENSLSCCYDCPCPAGQYCDTDTQAGPSRQDACRAEDFSMRLESVGSLDLQDSSKDHAVPVNVRVSSFPSGTELSPTCTLAGGDVDCYVTCRRSTSSNPQDYLAECDLMVPAMDYVSSPYYSPSDRLITLEQNHLSINMTYFDGARTGHRSLDQDLGNVGINVTSHCGEGSGDPFMMCESWLGEDQDTCCRDCGCSEYGDSYFCYTGASPNGQCVDNSTIRLMITGSEPDPWECVIGRIGGDCNYIRTHIIKAHVLNSPSDLQVIEARYSIGGSEPSSLECEAGEGPSDWECAIMPDSVSGENESGNGTLGGATRHLELFATAAYTIEGSDVVQELSASADFGTTRNKSEALLSCEEEIERLEEQFSSLETNQEGYNSNGMMYLIMGAIMVAIGVALLWTCETGAGCAFALMLIATGLVQIFLGTQGQDTGQNLDTQREQLEAMIEQKKEMCSSTEFEQLASATDGMMPISPIVY